MEHEDKKIGYPHNLVVYKEPLEILPVTIGDLMRDEGEKCLAENAIWFFLDNENFEVQDRQKLRSMFKRRGWNMFIWKYYLVSRAYLGGYKALSATLMLRKL